MFQFRLETSQRRYLYTAQIVYIVGLIVEPNLNALPAFLYNTSSVRYFFFNFSKIQQMSAGRGLYIRLNVLAEKGGFDINVALERLVRRSTVTSRGAGLMCVYGFLASRNNRAID